MRISIREAGVTPRLVYLVMECVLGSIVTCERGQSLDLLQGWRHTRDRNRNVPALVLSEKRYLIQQAPYQRRGLLVAPDELRRAPRRNVNNGPSLVLRSFYSEVINGIYGVGLKRNADYGQFIRFRSPVPEQHVSEIARGHPMAKCAASASAGVRAQRRDLSVTPLFLARAVGISHTSSFARKARLRKSLLYQKACRPTATGFSTPQRVGRRQHFGELPDYSWRYRECSRSLCRPS